jgi:lysozyme
VTLLGIDVSHYQGEVDWFAVARGSVKFAFAKATEGNLWVDQTFARNWKGIQEAGLFRGTYHFGRPGRDAETQAAHFASTVGPLTFRDLPPVLDLEEDDGKPAADVLSWARAFVMKAEALFGRKLMIYTGAFWRGPLKNPDDPFFRQRALWLAAYVKNPVVPASWPRATIWQYTEGQNNGPIPVPGVRPCDQNRFEGTEAELAALCGSGAPIVAPDLDAGAPGAVPAWPGAFFVWPHTPPMSGAAIKQWQERMVTLGFALGADGVYGPRSKAACAAFQKDRGLSADGIVGRRTWDACFAA